LKFPKRIGQSFCELRVEAAFRVQVSPPKLGGVAAAGKK
jgi:hypothetical protein